MEKKKKERRISLCNVTSDPIVTFSFASAGSNAPVFCEFASPPADRITNSVLASVDPDFQFSNALGLLFATACAGCTKHRK